jgi:hypothetical protein
VARQRCWRYNWVLDLDIKAFFDSIGRLRLAGGSSARLSLETIYQHVYSQEGLGPAVGPSLAGSAQEAAPEICAQAQKSFQWNAPQWNAPFETGVKP